MALIKCPECGKEVSDKAKACPNCGFPINDTKVEEPKEKEETGNVTIYGIRQGFLLGGTMKIYLDGEYFDSVKKGGTLKFKVNKDTKITAKCGINPAKGEIVVHANENIKIQIVYNRIGGNFWMEEIDCMSGSNTI